MKIGTVNSFGQVKTNNVHFEAQNKERENRGAHSNPIKNTLVAVPLATLLAMSPLNSSAAERNSVINNANKTEQVEQEKVKIVRTIAPPLRDYEVNVTNNGELIVIAQPSDKSDDIDYIYQDGNEYWFGYRNYDGKVIPARLKGIQKVDVTFTVEKKAVRREKYTRLVGEILTADRKKLIEVPQRFSYLGLTSFCEDLNNDNIPRLDTSVYPKIKVLEPYVDEIDLAEM